MQQDSKTKLHNLIINDHELVALEYNSHLDSVPLIFIHGIFNSIYLWEPIQLTQIKEDFHWFSLSLPGHHPAKLPHDFDARDLTADTMAEVMSEAVRQLTGGHPAWVVGYSTGANVTLCIAHHAPELIDRMVILEGFAKGVWGEGLRLTQIRGQLTGFMQAIFTPQELLQAPTVSITQLGYNILATDIKRMVGHSKTKEVVRSNRDTLLSSRKLGYYPYFRTFFHQDISAWLPEIEIETLILHSDEDRVVCPEHAYWIHHLLPNSELRWIAGSGHLPFLERPHYYEDHLVRWLNKPLT